MRQIFKKDKIVVPSNVAVAKAVPKIGGGVKLVNGGVKGVKPKFKIHIIYMRPEIFIQELLEQFRNSLLYSGFLKENVTYAVLIKIANLKDEQLTLGETQYFNLKEIDLLHSFIVDKLGLTLEQYN
jgi:hypothetical protein